MGNWSIEVARTDSYLLKNRELQEQARKQGTSIRPTENTVWFGARVEGVLVGCVSLRKIDSSGPVLQMGESVVVPRWRAVGVEGALIEGCIDWSIGYGAKRVEIATDHPQVFSRFGFRPSRDKDGVMIRDLSG